MIAGLLMAAAGAVAPARFTARLQPWRSENGTVALLRPASAAPTFSDAPFGALTTGGWRLIWDGSAPSPGKLLLRLALPARGPAGGQVTEVLQIGVGTGGAVKRTCLRFGLDGGSGRALPDRAIGGVRFTARANGDAGMSQRISATDYRAVLAGRCYAVERFSYAIAPGVASPTTRRSQADAAAALDAALASLRIDPQDHATAPAAPDLRLPPGTIAR